MKSRLKKLTVDGRLIKRLLGNRVLLERIEDPYARPSGLILLNRWTPDSVVFKVLAISPKATTEAKPGDRILSRHWLDSARHGTSIEVLDHADGRGRVVVDAKEILAVL